MATTESTGRAAAPTESGVGSPAQTWIALLGRRDTPTDGVEDYCSFLGQALVRKNIELRQTRVPWVEKGWLGALRSLWAESANWRKGWVLLQYTTMAWSRRGFPFGVLAVLAILRRRGVRCAVIFHEPVRQNGERWIEPLGGACQDWVIRRLYAGANKAIFADPLEKIPWLPADAVKAAFIPIGANIPEGQADDAPPRDRKARAKTVAVFCLSEAPNRHRELGDIAHAMQFVARQGVDARVVFLGRGTAEAKKEIESLFASPDGQALNLGLQSAEEVRRILSESDAMLCVRGPLYMRRGSALAGLACGLPLVGYAGEAEGTPLEEAGVELVPYLDRDALGKALVEVLTDQAVLEKLRRKSFSAQRHLFSWDVIASRMVSVLDGGEGRAASLKVVLYSEYFFPVSGGVQTNIFELACGLTEWRDGHPDRDGVEVTVITRTAEPTAEDSSWPFRLVRRPSFTRLVRLLRNADVVHVAGPVLVPMLVGLLLRKPVFVEHHGYQSICPNGMLLLGTDRAICPGHFMSGHYGQCIHCNSGDMGRMGSLRALALQFPRRWLCKLASSNIAITDHVARRIVLPRTKTILYGIRDTVSVPLPQNGNAVEIGYVGRLVPEKGLPVLLKAAKRLQDDGLSFRLTFVGSGPLRKKLEDESRELGIARHVRFTGELAGADLERAARPLQIVVMPSLWEETAGLAAIEQMMRGGVVIASDIGGLSEVVGEAGLKVPPGDADALYGRLREVLESPSLAASLGASARARATQLFGRDSMIGAHVSEYLETMR